MSKFGGPASSTSRTVLLGVVVALVAIGVGAVVFSMTDEPDRAADGTRTPGQLAGRLVLLQGTAVMEVDGLALRQVATVPRPEGFELTLTARANHVLVQAGHTGYLFDATTWAPPIVVGPYFNVPIVLGDDGYWAADADGATFRFYDWQGKPAGRPVAAPPAAAGGRGPNLVAPVGVTDRGLVAHRMDDGRSFVLAADGVRDLGPGRALAASGGVVVLLHDGGRVVLHDLQTGRQDRIHDGGSDLAPTAVFSPAGTDLVLLTVDATGKGSAMMVSVKDRATGRIHAVNEPLGAAWDGEQVVIATPRNELILLGHDPGTAQLTLPGGVAGGFAVVPRREAP